MRLLVDLAAHYEKGPVLLKEIARCEKISKKYLEQIVIALRTAGLVAARRGARGGYYLTRPPHRIKLIQLYRILEGHFALVECLDNPRICKLVKGCPTRGLWGEISKSVEKTLGKLTLADLVKRKNR